MSLEDVSVLVEDLPDTRVMVGNPTVKAVGMDVVVKLSWRKGCKVTSIEGNRGEPG
jgi:hypothetical protein